MSTSTRRSPIFKNGPGGDRRRLERKAARGDEGAARRLAARGDVVAASRLLKPHAEGERVRMAASLGHPAARTLHPDAPDHKPLGSELEFVDLFGWAFAEEFVLLALDMEQATLRRVTWDVHAPDLASGEPESRRCTESHSAEECPKRRMTPDEVATWDAYYEGLRRAVKYRTALPASPAKTTWQHWDCESAETAARRYVEGGVNDSLHEDNRMWLRDALYCFIRFWDDGSSADQDARRSEWVRRRLADLILEPLLEGPR